MHFMHPRTLLHTLVSKSCLKGVALHALLHQSSSVAPMQA